MLYDKIEKAFRDTVYTRADDNGTIFYFSSDDFSGLYKTPYSLTSSDGHTLKGYFYFYDGYKNGRIIVFEHGMGSGHRGYMKEIELLARHGYLVFAYDHTGCMESGGETTGGFVQSLKDLNDVINTLKSDPDYKDLDISVVGHSWGAFSSLNIPAFHPDIKHIAALSGFISVPSLLNQFFGGILSGIAKRIYEAEKNINPDFIDCNAVSALKNINAKVLIIHSNDDKTVSCRKNFDIMQKELSSNPNITFVRVSGKGHNPNYTADAVKYKDDFFKTYKKTIKKNLLKTDSDKSEFIKKYDWNRMTAQDEEIWNLIFNTLDS